MKKQKGFTLIELLVVIAIIAILSTVVMAGLNSARAKSRDAKRISEVKSLQKALDLYLDTCGNYPLIDGSADIGATGGLLTTTQDGTACTTSGDTFGTFMATLPANPQPAAAARDAYNYCSTDNAGVCSVVVNDGAGIGYQILFGLEGTTGSLDAGERTATQSGIL